MDKAIRGFYTINYWKCNEANHRHQHKETANKCIERHKEMIRCPKEERLRQWIGITQDYCAGLTRTEIAEKWGRNKACVGQVPQQLFYRFMWEYRRLVDEREFGLLREIVWRPRSMRQSCNKEAAEHFLEITRTLSEKGKADDSRPHT